ncbi:unnamed protein product, partial [Prorocentrum cordatum]
APPVGAARRRGPAGRHQRSRRAHTGPAPTPAPRGGRGVSAAEGGGARPPGAVLGGQGATRRRQLPAAPSQRGGGADEEQRGEEGRGGGGGTRKTNWVPPRGLRAPRSASEASRALRRGWPSRSPALWAQPSRPRLAGRGSWEEQGVRGAGGEKGPW